MSIQPSNPAAAEKLLTVEEVKKCVCISTSAIYRLMSLGQFPKPIKIGNRARWLPQEIRSYIEDRMAARDMGSNMGRIRKR